MNPGSLGEQQTRPSWLTGGLGAHALPPYDLLCVPHHVFLGLTLVGLLFAGNAA